MTHWTTQVQAVLGGRGIRHCVFAGGKWVNRGQALELLATSADFRSFLSQCITDSPFKALRWETPPLSTQALAKLFEFVLIDAPYLETSPDEQAFSSYFVGREESELCLAVPNLSRTATLVVPRRDREPEAYVHLKRFLTRASQNQVHSMWRVVAETARQQVQDQPLWLSTAGGGVSWLHVRLERTPKYYAYQPYKHAA